jgi:hypothetical protein
MIGNPIHLAARLADRQNEKVVDQWCDLFALEPFRCGLIYRSAAKIASIRLTASKTMGRDYGRLWSRAFDAMSASSNSLRLSCAQQAASVTGHTLCLHAIN